MPVGSGSGAESEFLKSDLQDPDPAENGPKPQPCLPYSFILFMFSFTGTLASIVKANAM